MSKRGVALKGKYEGIYQRKATDGTYIFSFRVKYTDDHGRKREKEQSFPSKREALIKRNNLIMKRDAGQSLESQERPPATLGFVAEQYLSSKTDRRSYPDIERLTLGPNGPVSFFGEVFEIKNMTDSEVRKYSAFLDQVKKEPTIKTFGKENPKRLIPRRGTEPLSNRTKNSYLSQFQALLRKAWKMGLIPYIPEVPTHFIEDSPELQITLEQVKALLDHLPTAPKPHRAMVLMTLFTGQRFSDLSQMKKKQIMGPIAPGTPIRWYSTKTRKRGKPRKIISLPMSTFLAQELVKLSHTWDTSNELLFANPDTGRAYTSIKTALFRACDKIGIPRFRPNLDLRHLAATEYLRDLRDPHAVAKIMGHGSSQMIDARYGHLVDRADPAVDAFDTKWEQIQVGQRWG